MFFEENKQRLEDFSRMSQTAGARADYVQGGGGNTSVKLADGLMAIKASGFCLGDIRPDKAYAVLNYEDLRTFYRSNTPESLGDVEAEGSACTKASTKTIEGLAQLRPSVEAGFHSVLKTFVLHTHSVYANLAACSTACEEIAAKALAGADYTYAVVPYVNPGAMLTFTIQAAVAKVETETGKAPSVILMQNHGIIAHDDDADVCMAIHADANARLAHYFHLSANEFPHIHLRPLAAGIYGVHCPYLRSKLRNCCYSGASFVETPLYPDQMVFLIDAFYLDKDSIEEGQCVASTKTGEMLLQMDGKKALTVAETVTAVLFIQDTIEKNGYTIATMGDAAKDFIANWESEKYRKSLAAKK
ncbi:MAG: class II aldolase/adducin family protein [Eubacteriales bacterium]